MHSKSLVDSENQVRLEEIATSKPVPAAVATITASRSADVRHT
jgi:hypothetical protein